MGLFDKLKSKKEQESAGVAAASAETTLVPGIGRMPYPAYRGSEPYLFVSYSHLDSAQVFAEIKGFNEHGYHVWYDEGISPGNEWTDEIASALEHCALFVVFFTPNSAASTNVQNEIDFALDEKKPCIAIHLKETTLRGGIKLRFGTKQAILKHNMSEEEYLYKYTSAFQQMGLPRKGDLAPAKAGSSPAAPTATADSEQQRRMPSEIERIQNSPATMHDFEWAGSAAVAYHGIKKRFSIPDRAAAVLSYTFKNNELIEQVTLGEGVTSLGADAFYRCPNLELVVIQNDDLRIDEPGAFSECPKLKVQCRKGSVTHETLRRTFSGEILFFEDVDRSSIPSDTAESAPTTHEAPAAPPAQSTDAERRHKWGDYVPSGTAIITKTDGTVLTAAANSLVLKVSGIEKRCGLNECLYIGMDNPSDDLSYQCENMEYFMDMAEIQKNGDRLTAKNVDDELKDFSLPDNAEIWFLSETDTTECSSVCVTDLKSIVFDRAGTPTLKTRFCTVCLEDGCFLSPLPFLWFSINMGTVIPEMHLARDLTKFAGSPLQLKRIKKLVVTKNGREGNMFSAPEGMELTAYLKNGEELDFNMEGYYTIYAMAGRGAVKSLSRAELKYIDLS